MTRTFNLADLFEIVVGAVPERTAFICGTQQLSFAELDRRATQLASALRARGVQRGHNVGIQLHNCAAYLETFFACCKIGAAPVNINYRYVAEELEHLYTSLELRALVFGAAHGAAVAEVAQRAPTLSLLLHVGSAVVPASSLDYEAVLASGESTLHDPGRSEDDLYILCTGGTTGRPKGVMWPHKALFMAALGGGGIYFRRPPVQTPQELAALVPSGPALRYFACAPLMHGAAMWSSLISLLAGHAVVVNDQAHFDATHVWDIVERDGVDVLSVVGDAMALPLVEALEAQPQRWNLAGLRIFGNGGAVLSGHLQQRLARLLPDVGFNNGMGSSESGVLGGEGRPAKGEGFIRIAPRPDLALVDEAMRIVTAPGARGVLARTGYTPVGYYGDPAKSAQTFVTIEGRVWVLTGDQARVDEEGHIVVLGRGSQCINTGGEKVFPEEVEEVARRYVAVADVVVVGLPDPRWGQRVVAVVQVAPGREFDRAAFERVCREYLSGYKVPREVFIAPEVRRSPAGKTDYRWAGEFAAAQSAGR
jgi:fatty-acyl-CoA synthase